LGHYAFHCPVPPDLLANLLQAGELPMSDFMDYKQQWEASVAKQTQELERLKAEHAAMKKALILIASPGAPEMARKDHWLGFSVDACATFLAHAVILARDALKEQES
jgi:hypothetical protein